MGVMSPQRSVLNCNPFQQITFLHRLMRCCWPEKCSPPTEPAKLLVAAEK